MFVGVFLTMTVHMYHLFMHVCMCLMATSSGLEYRHQYVFRRVSWTGQMNSWKTTVFKPWRYNRTLSLSWAKLALPNLWGMCFFLEISNPLSIVCRNWIVSTNTPRKRPTNQDPVVITIATQDNETAHQFILPVRQKNNFIFMVLCVWICERALCKSTRACSLVGWPCHVSLNGERVG